MMSSHRFFPFSILACLAVEIRVPWEFRELLLVDLGELRARERRKRRGKLACESRHCDGDIAENAAAG